MEKNILSKTYPYLIAVLLFIVLSFIYFSPVLEGKRLMGHDTRTYTAVSKELRDYKESTGQDQFWTNSLFSGMPSYQVSGYQGKGVVKYVNNFLNIIPRPVSFAFLYLLCGFLLLLSFGVKPWLSTIGAILFAFASYNFIIIAAGHNTKALTIAYIMPLIGSVILAYRGKRLWGTVLTALSLALAVFSNHLQILYYALMILGIFFVIEFVYAIIERKLNDFVKTTGLLIIGALIGIGMNAAPLMATYEYSKDTMRGDSNGLTIDPQSTQEGLSVDYITQWSYGIPETMTLLIPNFRGGASGGLLSADSYTAQALKNRGVANVDKRMETDQFPLYWGTQPFTSGPVYVGAIVCLLFVFGLFVVKDRYKWWLLAVTVLSILLAWGHNFLPFTRFFIDYVPMYNKFRSVSMTLVMAGISMPLLGMLALKKVFDGSVSKEKLQKGLLYSTAIVGGICLLFAVIPSLAGNFTSPSDARYGDLLQSTLPLDRKAMLRSDAVRSLIFILLSAVTIFLIISEKLKKVYGIIILGLLFTLDLYPVAKRYLNDKNFVDKAKTTYNAFTPTAANKYIMQDKELDFRVLDLSMGSPFTNAETSYFHKSIGGYHAAKLRRYQELINIHLDREISAFITLLNQAQTMDEVDEAFNNIQVLNMLNTKYVITNGAQMPLENRQRNGEAWLVEKMHVVDNADEEMTLLGNINTKTEAVADKMFADKINTAVTPDSLATINLVSYAPMNMKYHFKAATDQLAVFSEIYYEKGWNAYINGEKADYFRTNYLLRGMSLKAGEYDIEFRFEPEIISIGDTIAIISSILLIAMLAYLIFMSLKKKPTENNA